MSDTICKLLEMNAQYVSQPQCGDRLTAAEIEQITLDLEVSPAAVKWVERFDEIRDAIYRVKLARKP